MKYLCVAILWCSSVALAQSTSHGEVTIYRDAMGVPHIVGKTSAAVMYGLGYSLAQDRLAQLELARRGALGTRAEILGSSSVGTDTTARDRTLGSAELMRMYRTIPPEHQAMMQSYVDGINRYVAEIARDPEHKTPYEFTRWRIVPQPWTLLDYLAIIAAMPIGRAGYELQNLAFLDAMVAQYGPEVGRRIFEDVVPINDPDSPTTIPEGEDLAPRQPMPKPGYFGGASAGLPRVSSSVDLMERPAEASIEASRCLVIGPSRSASGHVLMMEARRTGRRRTSLAADSIAQAFPPRDGVRPSWAAPRSTVGFSHPGMPTRRIPTRSGSTLPISTSTGSRAPGGRWSIAPRRSR